MPYRTVWVDPEVLLEHAGVTVYRTYKDDDVDEGPRTFWFTTDLHVVVDSDVPFDVRDLAKKIGTPLDQEDVIRGRIEDGPARTDEEIRSIIRAAIDRGLLP